MKKINLFILAAVCTFAFACGGNSPETPEEPETGTEEVENMLDKAKSSTEDAANAAMDAAKEGAETVGDAATEGAETVGDAVKEGVDAVKEGAEEVHEDLKGH